MNENLPPSYVHRSLKWKSILTYAVVLLVLLACGLKYFYSADRPAGSETVTVEIPREATGREIADILEEKGVIRSAGVFRTMLWLTGKGNKLQSGHYRLRQGLSAEEAIEELKHGRLEMERVTVPEGFTVRQIAEALEKEGIQGAKDFLDEAKKAPPYEWMRAPEDTGVEVAGEGFLFPDTYEMPKESAASDICEMMYRRTDEMVRPEIREAAKKKNLTPYELVTLASMVEREAHFKDDQVPIASVMLARLEKGMPLQIDATVQYALGKTKPELLERDLKVDSPYNTYLHTGLPPGPIGSPGIDAIEAVLTAEPGEYLYYVAEKDGHHVFTKSLEEHRRETERIYGSTL